MKTIQCAHPPHHHDGFVATCRLWTASGGVTAPTTVCSLTIRHAMALRSFDRLLVFLWGLIQLLFVSTYFFIYMKVSGCTN